MKLLLAAAILLLVAGLARAGVTVSSQTVIQVYNPFTGRPDYITQLSTTSIQAGSNVTVVATPSGVSISATGGGGSSSPLSVGTGTASAYTTQVTSPTAVISFQGNHFQSIANGTTNFVSLNLNDIVLSSATVAVFSSTGITSYNNADTLLTLNRIGAGPVKALTQYQSGGSASSYFGQSYTGLSSQENGLGFFDSSGIEVARQEVLSRKGFELLANHPLLLFDSTSGHYTGFQASSTVSSNALFIVPAVDGTAGQALITDGNKNLSFGTISGMAPNATYYIQARNSLQSGATAYPSFAYIGSSETVFGPLKVEGVLTASGTAITTVAGLLDATKLSGLVPNTSLDTSSVTKGGVLFAGSGVTISQGVGVTTISASGASLTSTQTWSGANTFQSTTTFSNVSSMTATGVYFDFSQSTMSAGQYQKGGQIGGLYMGIAKFSATTSSSVVSTGFSASDLATTLTTAVANSTVTISAAFVATQAAGISPHTCTFTIFRGSTNLGDSTNGFAVYNPGIALTATGDDFMTLVFDDVPGTVGSYTYTVYAKTDSGSIACGVGAGEKKYIRAQEFAQ